MSAVLRLVALFFVLLFASAAWLILAGVMDHRATAQQNDLYGDVSDLWGAAQNQAAPTLTFRYVTTEPREEPLMTPAGQPVRDLKGQPVTRWVSVETEHSLAVPLSSTTLDVRLKLDQRRKGLMWFSLYDVVFQGDWTYTHARPEAGLVDIRIAFPNEAGVYDDFHLFINEAEATTGLVLQDGAAAASAQVAPGETLRFSVRYASRGLDSWQYQPLPQAGRIDAFKLTLHTDFDAIDYPAWSLSPSSREQSADGWTLVWDFDSIVTGYGMGMVMPTRIQAGRLASEMSLSAPVSLALFMLWLYVLGLLRGVEIHPVNHLLLAGAFFAFHLLFGYTADRLPVEWAFALSSLVSLFLVVSYLRLVTGPRFAIVQAGGAQIVYLIGFSLAHFWDGFTGLTITVLGILTLFAIMQLTGRIKWAEVFAKARA